ncbi:MAG: hypothetical protein EXX96DRAFT_608665 [Benjaminiella poitrasii]|nr:MAG: hypothetical protein EXX96DRAFT_608665 [Benjaminiella poitrasii]
MYKSAIKRKKDATLRKREQKSTSSSSDGTKCKDCEELGHYGKHFYKCKLYKEATADDVGTSTKKRNAKKPRASKKSDETCNNCKQEGHKSSRSPECENHILSKTKFFKEI